VEYFTKNERIEELRMPIAKRDYWNDDRYRPRNTKPPKWSWGAIGLVLIALFASGLPMKLYNELTIHHDQKIRSYLQEREQYFSSSDQSFKQLMTKVNKANGDLSSLKMQVNETDIMLKQNYLKLMDLKPPKNFKDLHTKTMELNVIKQAAVDYLISSSKTNSYQHEILSTYINENNMMFSQLQPLMIEGLQKANLRYKINQDGSLTYWVKDDYAGSLE
jgi:septal ring factor EnvC (AmiA/AmiB activator)